MTIVFAHDVRAGLLGLNQSNAISLSTLNGRRELASLTQSVVAPSARLRSCGNICPGRLPDEPRPDHCGGRLAVIINRKGPTMIPFSLPTATVVRGTMVMVAMMVNSPTVARAELNVLMSGGFGGAYEKLLPEFERTTGVKVTTRSGASQGSGPQTIAAQLAQGVPADVLILSREGLNELIAANKIGGGTDVDLAQVPLVPGFRSS